MSNKIIFAKPTDIQIGTKIGLHINGHTMFTGRVDEITYTGININGYPFIGGYYRWSENSRMSFSVGENNTHVILLED